jgi:D-serine dehydratase
MEITMLGSKSRREDDLGPREKGMPPVANELSPSDTGAQGWSLLNEDLPLPVAVLKQSALVHNSRWMKGFVAESGARIAPHGKTTMSPALFDLQLADGAWGVTLSTPHQIQVARSFGYNRIFMANQLVGRAGIDFVLSELRDNPDFEFYCLVDSRSNVEALAGAARRLGLARKLGVLVELGYPGGRTGCRSVGEAFALASFVAGEQALCLSGIEGFEGLLRGRDAQETHELVNGFLDRLTALAARCSQAGLFTSESVILSAGGSSFYDLVVAKLKAAAIGRPTVILLRAGCYITHDSVMYVRAFDALGARDPELAAKDGGLRAALEVWAYVQSRPEPTKAIVGFGKRDASYDDPPVALAWFRPSGAMSRPCAVPPGHQAVRLNDQHCHLAIPEDSPLAVGDMVAFGISHPCLTFDKWRVLHVVDDDYRVTSSIRTYF